MGIIQCNYVFAGQFLHQRCPTCPERAILFMICDNTNNAYKYHYIFFSISLTHFEIDAELRSEFRNPRIHEFGANLIVENLLNITLLINTSKIIIIDSCHITILVTNFFFEWWWIQCFAGISLPHKFYFSSDYFWNIFFLLFSAYKIDMQQNDNIFEIKNMWADSYE